MLHQAYINNSTFCLGFKGGMWAVPTWCTDRHNSFMARGYGADVCVIQAADFSWRNDLILTGGNFKRCAYMSSVELPEQVIIAWTESVTGI